MARKFGKNDEKLNYSAAIRELKQLGPERAYLLWGPEDYLREQYLRELKRICLPEGEDSFSYHRMDGPELDMEELRRAMDALPFMTERSFIELRDIDINKLKDSDTLEKLLGDVPDYCVIAFALGANYEPDGRLKSVKVLRQKTKELKFTKQSQGQLTDWLVRRFAAAGKGIELDAAQRLIFISGELMSGLIPEIEKVAAYAKGERVTVSDVEAVANHIPEAVIFDMTEYIAQKKYNSALSVLSELLADKKQRTHCHAGHAGHADAETLCCKAGFGPGPGDEIPYGRLCHKVRLCGKEADERRPGLHTAPAHKSGGALRRNGL
ncbi:MAG: DNA polymerase III subunit delta [Oscillospiraceae bacterium]